MNCYVVNYITATSRRKSLLVLADTIDHARHLAENYLNDGKKICSITYVVSPEKNSST